MPASFGRGRSIVSQAGVWHEWDEEYEERGSGWWELFVDLLLVAACANVADQFKDDSTWTGLAVFVLQLTQFDSGWLHYTLFSSRYHDDSLFHSFLLFVYLLGTAVAVVHAKGLEPDDVVGFNVGQAVLRLALAVMHLSVAFASDRARGIALVDALFTLLHAGIFCIAAAVASDGNAVLACWVACIFLEVVVWAQTTRLLGVKGVPLNIDHMADRSGCFTMVVLGESVVSTAINYSSLASPERTVGYYAAMVLGFLLTFTLALSAFHMQPPREIHAYRRSRCHGIALGSTNRIMWIALLAMGVGIKQVMRAVTGSDDESMQADQEPSTDLLQARFAWLLMISLSLAFFCLAVIRSLHFWGRQPAPTDKPWVYGVKMVWWVMAFAWGVLPLAAALALTSVTSGPGCDTGMCNPHPVAALGAASACTTLMVIVETLLVQCLPPPGQHRAAITDDKKESLLLTPINQPASE
jgi:low temperature requirement protein LtrA